MVRNALRLAVSAAKRRIGYGIMGGRMTRAQRRQHERSEERQRAAEGEALQRRQRFPEMAEKIEEEKRGYFREIFELLKQDHLMSKRRHELSGLEEMKHFETRLLFLYATMSG